MQMQAGTWGAESPATAQESSERIFDRKADEAGSHINTAAPSSGSLWPTIYTDYRRYRAAGARNAFSVIALTQGFWASAVFRISHWALDRCRVPGLRLIIKALCLCFQKIIEILTGICIPATCNIGRGLYIGHFSGIFIDSEARFGSNCNIAQGVTIGKGGRGELHGVPALGDRVHVGANAIVLGKITVGNDAVIGPGAVVMSDIPPRGVAMGNPARVIGLTGSFEFVNYDNMENDPARKPQPQPVATERDRRTLQSSTSKNAQLKQEQQAPQEPTKASPWPERKAAATFTSPRFM